MNPILNEQIRRNREARQGWDVYRGHRDRVTHLLLTSAPVGAATLCVLGAGNCNDLDLVRLRAVYETIQLVDLDGDALLAGCELQGVADDAAIQRTSDYDVTGVADPLGGWQPQQAPSAAEIEGVVQAALGQPAVPVAGEPFDVVASVGLLTQLIEMTGAALGAQHPQFMPLMSAIRLRHWRRLLELTQPGGTAWLFTEIVSSVTCPELLNTPEKELLPVLQRAIGRHNFFTGVNPMVLLRLLQDDPELSAAVGRLNVPPPWLWQFFTRLYAVCAFGVKKKFDADQIPPGVE